MTRHIEFRIDFDLTCWAMDMEDFLNDDEGIILESIYDYFEHDSNDLLKNLKITKVWYEKDLENFTKKGEE